MPPLWWEVFCFLFFLLNLTPPLRLILNFKPQIYIQLQLQLEPWEGNPKPNLNSSHKPKSNPRLGSNPGIEKLWSRGHMLCNPACPRDGIQSMKIAFTFSAFHAFLLHCPNINFNKEQNLAALQNHTFSTYSMISISNELGDHNTPYISVQRPSAAAAAPAPLSDFTSHNSPPATTTGWKLTDCGGESAAQWHFSVQICRKQQLFQFSCTVAAHLNMQQR